MWGTVVSPPALHSSRTHVRWLMVMLWSMACGRCLQYRYCWSSFTKDGRQTEKKGSPGEKRKITNDETTRSAIRTTATSYQVSHRESTGTTKLHKQLWKRRRWRTNDRKLQENARSTTMTSLSQTHNTSNKTNWTKLTRTGTRTRKKRNIGRTRNKSMKQITQNDERWRNDEVRVKNFPKRRDEHL